MADARREHDFDVAIAHVCYLGAAISGEFKPTEANPYRERPPETAADRDDEAKEGWEFLRNALKQVSAGRG